jgi:hypothetical protein
VPFAVYEVRRVYQAKRTVARRAWHGQKCRTPRWWCRHEPTEGCLSQHRGAGGRPLCGGGPACRKPTAKGPPWRSVRTVLEGDRFTAEQSVRDYARERGATLLRGDVSGIQRAHYLNTGERYPQAHAFRTAAPVGAIDKQRDGFETVWAKTACDPGNSLVL